MVEEKRIIIEQVNKALAQLLAGKPIKDPLDDSVETDDPLLSDLILNINKLFAQYNDSYRYIIDLAQGKLDTSPPPRNSLINPFKQLQSDLLHLTWQIQQIAEGDYEQKVSFSGDFSEAFNKMITSLREKKITDDLNRENQELFETIFKTSPDGAVITDLSGNIQFISQSGKRMFLINDEQSKGRVNLFDYLIEDDRVCGEEYIQGIKDGKTLGINEFRVKREDGSVFWLESNANVIHDINHAPKGIFIILRDITTKKEDNHKLKVYSDELKLLNDKLVELSVTDPLTEVFNRRQFDNQLEQEIQRAERYGNVFSLVMFDLDHFRNYNNNYGHTAGDIVLHDVAQLIRHSIRKVDLVFRYGGEEFAIILPQTNVENAFIMTEKVRRAVETMTIVHNDKPLPPITASFGVACSEDHPLDSKSIVEAADKALYDAKQSGRNCTKMNR